MRRVLGRHFTEKELLLLQAEALAKGEVQLDSVESFGALAILLAPELEVPQGRLFAATAAAVQTLESASSPVLSQVLYSAEAAEVSASREHAVSKFASNVLAVSEEGLSLLLRPLLAVPSEKKLPDHSQRRVNTELNVLLLEHSLFLRLREHARRLNQDANALGSRQLALVLQELQVVEKAAESIKTNLELAQNRYREKALAA